MKSPNQSRVNSIGQKVNASTAKSSTAVVHAQMLPAPLAMKQYVLTYTRFHATETIIQFNEPDCNIRDKSKRYLPKIPYAVTA